MHPKELILELSHNCNLSCIMCGFVKERNKPEYFMTEATFNRIIDSFEVPPEIVRLNGRGESTIHPKFPQFLATIRQKWSQAQLHLFTNLNIFDASQVKLLKSYGVQLFISIDSSDPEKLAQIRRGIRWEIIERNLHLLADYQPRPFFVFTIQPENVRQIVDIAHLAQKFNVGLIYNVIRSDYPDYRLLNHVISDFNNMRHAFTNAREILTSTNLPCLIPDQIQGVELDLDACSQSNGTRAACPALTRETCIQYDGYVTPCNMFHPKQFGHISEHNISQILENDIARQFRKTHKQDSYCQNCAWLGGQ